MERAGDLALDLHEAAQSMLDEFPVSAVLTAFTHVLCSVAFTAGLDQHSIVLTVARCSALMDYVHNGMDPAEAGRRVDLEYPDNQLKD
jgi:hypothetical protein